jgi:hypothetical protein
MEMNCLIRMLKDKMDLGKYVLTKKGKYYEELKFTVVENKKYEKKNHPSLF